VAIALVAVVTLVAGGSHPVGAHTPHDDIFDVALSPTFSIDETVYAISRSLLLRSDDGGATWARLTNGLDHNRQYQVLAVSPSDPDIVLVGTEGTGISRSVDGGASWQRLDQAPSGVDIDVLDIAADGLVVAGGPDPAVHVSGDGGASWSTVDQPAGVRAAAFDSDRGTVLLGLENGVVAVSDDGGTNWRRRVVADSAVTALAVGADGSVWAGTAAGVVLSSPDGGATFTAGEVAPGSSPVMALAPMGADRPALWAVTGADGPVVMPLDGSGRWEVRATGLSVDAQSGEPGYEGREDFSRLAVSDDGATLFVAGFDGLFRSDDLGAGWTEVSTLQDVIVGFDVSPDYQLTPEVVVSTYVDGVHRSVDGGDRWDRPDGNLGDFGLGGGSGPVRLFNVVMSPDYGTDRTLYTSTDDELLRSTDGGTTWEGIDPGEDRPAGSPRVDIVALSPGFATDAQVFMGTREGAFLVSEDRGDTFSATADHGGAVRSIGVSPTFARDRTLFVSHSAGRDGSGEPAPPGVRRSRDGGRTWETLLSDVTGHLAVSPAFASDGTIFLATASGVLRSQDSGDGWQSLTIGGSPDERLAVEAIAVSPGYANDQTVLISVRGSGLWRSIDGGERFQPVGSDLIEQNLLASDFDKPTTRPIQFSPGYAEDGTIFVSTITQLYRTIDRGQTWTRVTPALAEPSPSASAASVPIVWILAVGTALVIVAAGILGWRRTR